MASPYRLDETHRRWLETLDPETLRGRAFNLRKAAESMEAEASLCEEIANNEA